MRDLNYGRDKKDLYMLGSAIGSCDVSSFRWLSDNWQLDRKCAYVRGTKLPNARPDTFVVLNDWYAKDSEQVYSWVSHKAIPGADAATFRLAEGPCSACARDKYRCYNAGENASCDFPR
jgi:DKNYY family